MFSPLASPATSDFASWALKGGSTVFKESILSRCSNNLHSKARRVKTLTEWKYRWWLMARLMPAISDRLLIRSFCIWSRLSYTPILPTPSNKTHWGKIYRIQKLSFNRRFALAVLSSHSCPFLKLSYQIFFTVVYKALLKAEWVFFDRLNDFMGYSSPTFPTYTIFFLRDQPAPKCYWILSFVT